MNCKVTFYVYGCVLLLGDTLAFSAVDFRRMFRGYCPPLRNCQLREEDCPYGGYAKGLLGCAICMCATSPTACEGVRCPYGQHCETINRRQGWFSLRNYRCVPDSVEEPVPQQPIIPFPVIIQTTREAEESSPEPTTISTTVPTTAATTPASTTTTTQVTAELATTTPNAKWPNICPGGSKPGAMCNMDRHCKSDQTCRIYPDLEYGACCDNEKLRPQEETQYRFIPRCKQTQDIGPCRSLIPRYFYNSTSGTCEMFIFGGCGNNDNNFRSYAECQKHCENPCRLPSYAGRCRAAMARIYYDYETNRCNVFYFGGCPNEANGNNWDSFEECYSHCYDHTRK